MQGFRRMTFRPAKTAYNSSRATNETKKMSSLTPRHSSTVGRSSTNSSSWSFQELDMDNSVDDDGEIVIIGEKRGGVFQNLSAAGQRRPFRDVAEDETERPRKSPKLDGARRDGFGSQSDATADVPRDRYAGSKATSNLKAATSTKTLPFLLEDDSDTEEDESVLLTPPNSVYSGSSSSTDLQIVPTAAQKDAARQESRRLREEALANKRTTKAGDGGSKPFGISEKKDLPKQSDSVAKNPRGRQHLSDQASEIDAKPVYFTKEQQHHIGTPTSSLDSSRELSLVDTKPDLSWTNRNSSAFQPRLVTSGAFNDPKTEKKEAILRAKKEADARRAAEWEARQQQKKDEELKRHQENEKARATQRDAALKRQAAQQAEQDAFAARASVLKKIQAQTKATSEQKAREISQRLGLKKPTNNSTQIPNAPVAKPRVEGVIERIGQAKNDTKNMAATPTLESKPTETRSEMRAPNTITQSHTTNLHVAPVASAAPSPEDKAREERVRAKEERNAKLHRSEEERNAKLHRSEEEHEDEALADPTPLAPISLNSLAGQNILAGPNKQAQAVSLNVPHSKTPETGGRSHRRPLKEILPQDIRVLKWKDHDNIPWPQIVTLFENLTGQKRAVKTLQEKYNKINKALSEVQVDRHLLDLVALGDGDASQKLHEIVHGVWPLPEKPREKVRESFISLPRHTIQKLDTPHDGHSTSPDTLSFESSLSTEQAVQNQEFPNPTTEDGHPEFGGKTITPAAMKYFLEAYQEVLKEEHDDALEAFREPSPAAPKDRCHFVYQVQSRHISQEELDDDILIDSVAWTYIGPDYEIEEAAHIQAEHEVLRLRAEWEKMGVEDYSTHFSKTTEGFSMHTLEGAMAGIAQVQITRKKRTYHDGILPKSKKRWAPATLYEVMLEVIKKSTGDDMFEESSESITIRPFIGIYSDLEDANERAVKEFVKLTFEPKSIRLTVREAEIQEEVDRWLAELEKSKPFRQSAENEDGSEKNTIWVEENRLHGPRNLW